MTCPLNESSAVGGVNLHLKKGGAMSGGKRKGGKGGALDCTRKTFDGGRGDFKCENFVDGSPPCAKGMQKDHWSLFYRGGEVGTFLRKAGGGKNLKKKPDRKKVRDGKKPLLLRKKNQNILWKKRPEGRHLFQMVSGKEGKKTRKETSRLCSEATSEGLVF